MMAQNAKEVDPRLVAVADWLRNEKKSGLITKEAVQYEKRVEYFKGSKLVDALTGPKYKGKLAKDTPIKTRAEAAKLAQELLRVGFIHRSQRFQHAHSRRWELELFNGPFEEDGLFTWVYEGTRSGIEVVPSARVLAGHWPRVGHLRHIAAALPPLLLPPSLLPPSLLLPPLSMSPPLSTPPPPPHVAAARRCRHSSRPCH